MAASQQCKVVGHRHRLRQQLENSLKQTDCLKCSVGQAESVGRETELKCQFKDSYVFYLHNICLVPVHSLRLFNTFNQIYHLIDVIRP